MTIITGADQLDLLAPPQHRKTDPPASRQGAAIKRATAKADAALSLDSIQRAGVNGRTSHEVDREYAWASRSGSPAGKRMSELLRLPDPAPIVRLQAMRNGCHIHVAREVYDPQVHGETCGVFRRKAVSTDGNT